ncbi:dephospho-CoA kinase [Mycoplasma sp. CSL7503-lung]|uniref:dephospho-CoA kinase n=1 Tax=Mycoplasma sp. CSL7503-lung TaxID=536372 RepID=UPI0021CE5BA5|nr:dephospho-CoA kinase [Mycoplasma sp. CSL7503-lung]MCU4706720.1 dephospho-CoA kinase [Mycoplasma sp. CSL7503-lung]
MNLENTFNKPVAICGQIGSGKTTIIQELKKMGYSTLILDDYVSNLYKTNNKLIYEMKEQIGDFIIKEQIISKQLLKEWILKDFNNIYKIENIIYPYIYEHLLNNNYDFIEMPVLDSERIDFSELLKYVVVIHRKNKFVVENTLVDWLNKKNDYIIDLKRKNKNLIFVDIYNDNQDITKKIKKILVKTQ